VTPEEAEEYTQSLGQIGGGLWRQILWAERQRIPAVLGLSLRQWVDERLGGYVKLAIEQRREIVKQLTAPVVDGGEGLSNREAADIIGVAEGTIRNDLKPDAQDYAPELVDALDTQPAPEPDAQDYAPEPDPQSVENPVDLPATEADRADVVLELARQSTNDTVEETPAFPDGPFSCIVIDPPWPVRKIERATRPWQGAELDYPVMKLDEIEALPVDKLADTDAHLYLWVTHRYLPDGLRLLAAWGFNYQCVMTWNKNTGIVPYSWMYDTEHVLFGTRGKLKIAKRGQRLSFDEPVNGHSVKPSVFYDRVRSASPGRRLDMFPGVEHDGFEPWGLEASHRAVV